MSNQRSLFILLLFILSFVQPVFAQDEGAKGNSQVGLFYGRLLPNNVDRDDEIFAMWGGRYSMPLAETTYLDAGILMGHGSDVDWKGVFTTLGIHIPVETLVGHAGLGADFTRYEVNGQSGKQAFGLHFVGGVMAKIGGNSYLRFDMKMTTKPGTSLFFGLGLVFELGGAEAGGS